MKLSAVVPVLVDFSQNCIAFLKRKGSVVLDDVQLRINQSADETACFVTAVVLTFIFYDNCAKSVSGI